MKSIEQEFAYSIGLEDPDNYDENYLATKNIQHLPLFFRKNIVESIASRLKEHNIYIEDDKIIYEIVSGLIKGNIILQGPPGTGKTTIANIICECFDVSSDIITATDDWTTYDTIGGYQPDIDEDGNEIIAGKNGKIIESIIKSCNIIRLAAPKKSFFNMKKLSNDLKVKRVSEQGEEGQLITEEAPTEEAPTEEAPTEEAPTEEAPTEEAPTEEAPTGEAPTEEAPTGEAPTERVKKHEKITNEISHFPQAHWTIIDELNRSEIDKVFGDLFTVFGSDDLDKKLINLWFHKEKYKKTLYVPNRYRVIGIINNVDKNFVFNLSQGLSRRFNFITINPPKEENFEEEIRNVRENIIINKILKKMEGYQEVISKEIVSSILNDESFISAELSTKEFIKKVRYFKEDESEKGWLGLQLGTAQIIDVYENVIISLIFQDFINKYEKEVKEILCLEIFDLTIKAKIVPQMDGYNYEQLLEFYESMKSSNAAEKFKQTIDEIGRIVL